MPVQWELAVSHESKRPVFVPTATAQTVFTPRAPCLPLRERGAVADIDRDTSTARPVRAATLLIEVAAVGTVLPSRSRLLEDAVSRVVEVVEMATGRLCGVDRTSTALVAAAAFAAMERPRTAGTIPPWLWLSRSCAEAAVLTDKVDAGCGEAP
jgi:hypothetical protein